MVSYFVPRIPYLCPWALGFQASHLADLVFHLGSKKPNSYPHASTKRTLPAEPSACPSLGCLDSKLNPTLIVSLREAMTHLCFPDPWFYGTAWWDPLRLGTHRPLHRQPWEPLSSEGTRDLLVAFPCFSTIRDRVAWCDSGPVRQYSRETRGL